MPDSPQVPIKGYRYTRQKLTLLLEKVGLVGIDTNSNPAAPTHTSSVYAIKNTDFDNEESSVADSGAKYSRKIYYSKSGYPYRPASLHPLDCDPKKSWYISFYAYDITTQKLVRKRVMKDELNEIPDIMKRIRVAADLIDEIDYFLYKDMHLQTRKPIPKILAFNFHGYSIIDAIEYARNTKLQVEGIRQGTADDYISTSTTVKEFLEFAGYPADYKLRDIVRNNFITQYFDYMKMERKVTNKTYNNRRAILHAVVELLIKRDRKLFNGVNPFKEVKKLKTETKKHAAYTDAQMNKITKAMIDGGEPHLVTFIQFMFYTLARPDELRNLKVGHIRLDDRKILFLSETAKTTIENYVGINDRLFDIIKKTRITEYPDHYYVFSTDKGHGPGEQRVSLSYFYKRISKYIRSLGFYNLNSNYTLYSFKHSGAISLYQATKDIKLLQAQCRHQNIEQTNIYLRDLGLFRDFDQLNRWTGPL